MRTLLITRLALAAAIAAGLAACAGPQPGGQATPAASPPAASSPTRPSPSLPATSPVTSPAATATSPAAPGTRPVTGWLAGKDWTVIPTSRRGVALTFDAGANPDDHTTLDAEALPQLISGLRAQGYSFVTLDALTS